MPNQTGVQYKCAIQLSFRSYTYKVTFENSNEIQNMSTVIGMHVFLVLINVRSDQVLNFHLSFEVVVLNQQPKPIENNGKWVWWVYNSVLGPGFLV